MNIKVAIFEDNNSLRTGLYQLINGSNGFEWVGAYSDSRSIPDYPFHNCFISIIKFNKIHPPGNIADI